MSIYTQDSSLPWCTYITFYKGNKLPPFYIGYSEASKVFDGTYHGSVTSKEYADIFRSEEKNHPHLFKTIPLTFHKTKREASAKESSFHYFFDVRNNPMYINMHNQGANFLQRGPHKEETKKKIGKANKGRLAGDKNPNYGKPCPEHQKQRISECNSGRVFNSIAIERMRNGQLGRKHSQESKDKRSAKHSRNWLVTFPDGHQEIITNLKKFCLQHDIGDSNCKLPKGSKGYKAVKLLSEESFQC